MCDKIIYDKNCNTIVQNEVYDDNFVYVYILQLNTLNKYTYNQTVIRDSEETPILFTIGKDGYYTLCRMIVPKDPLNPYYYKDGKFYNNIREVSLQELIEVNPEVSKIDITYFQYFQTCKIRKCFIKICQDILDTSASIKCDNNVVDKELVYKRDLLWSTLNVIQYMVDFEQFEEASRLLERISSCNGLCNDNSDCGCKCNCNG